MKLRVAAVWVVAAVGAVLSVVTIIAGPLKPTPWESGGRGEEASASGASLAGVAPVAPRIGIAPAVRAGPGVSIPAVIEENRGQFVREEQFVARARGYAIGFEREGLRIAVAAKVKAKEGSEPAPPVRIRFVGARAAEWRGEEGLAARTNYFVGREPQGWRREVPVFEAVAARKIYPGVDCVTRLGEGGKGARPEFDFRVAPGGDVRHIRWRFDGAGISLDPAGNLTAKSSGGEIELAKPTAYQEIPQEDRVGGSKPGESVAGRRFVEAKYVVEGGVVGLRVGKYDHARELVIDPSISVTYTTFLGGAGTDAAMGVAAGASGKVYVSGTTSLAGFQGLTGNSIGAGGGNDFFVAELDTTKTGVNSLVYLTFIRGQGTEGGGRLAVNSSGMVALVGTTTSSDYPVTDGSQRTSGGNDLAISVINASGTLLQFSTMLGGGGLEGSVGTPAVAFDPGGDVVVAADTTSTDLPVTVGAFQAAFGGGASDGMLAVYSPNGILSYLTYFGINAQVSVTGVAEDLLGQAYVAGFVSQPVAGGFAPKNALQSTYGGGPFDGMVMCVAPKGLGAADLVFATYLGGSAADEPMAVAVDGSIPANVYVAGLTESVDFPTDSTVAGFQTALKGPINGFLATIGQSSTGATSLKYSTYLGGSTSDKLLAVTALGPSAVYVAGLAQSQDFPLFEQLQPFGGTADAMLVKLDTTQAGAASMGYSTFLGGSDTAQASGVAASVSASGAANVFVAGETNSPDFPLAGNPQNGAQPICASCTASTPAADAFVTEISEGAAGGPVLTFNVNELNFGNQLVGPPNPGEVAVIENSGNAPLTISGVAVVGANAADFSMSESECPTAPQTLAVNATCSITVNFSPTLAATENAVLSVTDNASGSPQSLNLTGKGIEPVATFAPQAIAFGSQPQGSVSAQQVVTVSNTGDLALNISLLALAGANQSAFSIVAPNTCTNPPVIQPGASCSVGVGFEPPGQGQFSALLEFTDNQGNASGAVQTVALSGTGIPPSPVVSLVPASIAFGFQIFGTQSGPQPVTLTNTGTLPLQVSGFVITGAQPSDFVMGQVNTCPVGGGTMAAGASCQTTLIFAPSGTGMQTATVSVADNAPGSPQSVALSGVGTSASLAVNSTTMEFPAETLAVATAAQSATVKNTGTSAVQISGISVSGANPTDFPEANNCPLTGPLNAGASCKVQATFAPTGGGARSAAIFVASNAPGSPQVIALSGTGLVPQVALGAASEEFPSEIVGIESPVKTMTLKNTGNGGLAISKLAVAGANAGDFSASSDCGKVVAVGAACTVSIAFKATEPGARAATLQVEDNAIDSPQTVALSGAGTDFAIGPAGGGGLAMAVQAGETAKYKLEVTPEGGFAGKVELACAGAPAGASCTVDPAEVTVSGSGAAAFEVDVATEGAGGVEVRSGRWPFGEWGKVAALVAFLIVMLSVLLGGSRARGRARARFAWEVAACGLLAAALMVGVAGCGGGGESTSSGSSTATGTGSTPAGTYHLEVTGTSGGATRKAELTLAVQ